MNNNLPIEDIEAWLDIMVEARMFKLLSIDTPIHYWNGGLLCPTPNYSTYKVEAVVSSQTAEATISVIVSYDQKDEATRKFYNLVETFYNS